ncbi:BTB/POZ domain protein [Macrophomina phaseolina]|uniref:BTB/POZ domain protein n=1 Tax=Macrophomina phaseolina TaxID=35725 RepID=A0ABQ8FZE8_9PEZI|nr:BTB/POZ domain protein [Macrophomina phaseolina]
MPSVEPGSTLGLGLKECFHSPLYSDLRIKDSNGLEYPVHRVIVCSQSPEAQTGVISLEHDDPGAVKAMLEFMYHGSYTHADEDTAMLFVARAYAIGDIYCVPELKDHAAAQFEELASARWDTPDFAHAMRIIYESIPEKGRGSMRDIVVHITAQHHEVLLRVPEFQDTLDDFGVLGKDLLQALSNQLVDPPNVCISP